MRKCAVSLVLGLVVVVLAPPAFADDLGGFSLDCFYSHSAPDDPIVSPGVSGASHLHDFFGNRSANASSTYSAMEAAPTKCKLQGDTAGYWNPAMYLSGKRLPGIRMAAYYFNRSPTGKVETIPSGLQMIGGNSKAGSVGENPHVFWFCGLSSPTRNHPYNCTGYGAGEVVGAIDFPTCWDGTGLTRGDVAYQVSKGTCPTGFGHFLPLLSYRVHFGIADPCAGNTPCALDNTPQANIAISLSSGAYYTLHADFWNTWNQAALDNLVKSCLNARVNCGRVASSPTLATAPSLTATGGAGTVNLSWTAPTDTGGSPITGYNIYRSTNLGEENPFGAIPLASLGNVTSYQDAAVSSGTTYYYRVAPVNAVGEGRLSKEASATA